MSDLQLTAKRSALLFATAVFLLLFGGVVLLALLYDFGGVNLGGLLFLMSFLCCLFVAKNIYDVTVASYVSEPISRYSLLGATQSLYTQLFQKSPVPYCVISQQGEIVSANTAAARLLGLQQKQLAGQNVFSLIKADSIEHNQVLIEKFRSQVGISDELVSITRPDHREVWALLSLFAFENSLDERQGLLTLVDITKQKKAEDAKSEFVSLASHQLRTPIAGMKWSAELLQMDNPESLSERQHKYLNRLTDSIGRMAVLVDDFLRVSRFEMGNFRPVYSHVSLRDMCARVLEDFADTARHKQVTIHTNYDDRVDLIKTDENLLRMVLTNLCSNAVKYTLAGGVVQVGYRLDGRVLRITITDTGMGIPVAEQPQLFSKLFRASNAVENVPDGTGLGLYIVREAVAVLRGKVSCTSAEGQGTTFEVQLPYES